MGMPLKNTGRGLRGYQIRFVHFNRDRPLDQIDREHDSAAILPAHDNAFQAGHRSLSHADSPSCAEIGMRFDLRRTSQPVSQGLDFIVRQGSGLSVEGYDPDSTGELEHLQSALESNPHEDISWE